MAEIVIWGAGCGRCVHNPENSRVCAECKATDLADENREEIESALAYLDALTAIEIFRGTSHTLSRRCETARRLALVVPSERSALLAPDLGPFLPGGVTAGDGLVETLHYG